MKKIGLSFLGILLLLSLFIALYSQAQTTAAAIPLQRFQIGNSGCSALFPAAPSGIESTFDVDSNKVYIARAEVQWNNKETYVYSVHVLQLRNPDAVADEYDALAQYLDYIKSTLNIAAEEGYKKVTTLTRGKLAKALSDTWNDHSGMDIKVMGWIQGRTIAVLYAIGPGQLSAKHSIQPFLNGIQFPASF